MKNSGEVFRQIAVHGTILRTVVGSTVHGLSVNDQDDRDEMGICIEPAEYVTGLSHFEQYEHRTAWEREGKRDARSGPGDTDLVIYSLRKWMKLATDGSPTVLLPLFAPTSAVITCTTMGRELRELCPYILSEKVGYRFLGYLRAQRDKLENNKNLKVKRPELIQRYGFDTKFAGHMVRLGAQGVELLETGKITLPMPEPWRSWIITLRQGGVPKEHAMDQARAFEVKIEKLLKEGSSLASSPGYGTVNRWLESAYTSHWRGESW